MIRAIKFKHCILFLSFLILFTSCGDEKSNFNNGEVLIHADNKWQRSTPAGLLMATAIRTRHDLDIVLYPSELLNDSEVSFIKLGMNKEEIDNTLSLYPAENETDDQFFTGTMKGSNLIRFMFLQAEANYRNELQVDGLIYDYKFIGGQHTVSNIRRKKGLDINKDKYYRIAVSKAYFFGEKSLPGYLFGYGFNFTFRRFSDDTISAQKALRAYLQNLAELPLIDHIRGKVSTRNYGSVGRKTIAQIQGSKHLSTYQGNIATTTGIITAFEFREKHPGGTAEIYMQSLEPDNDDRTSEGLYVYVPNLLQPLQVGDVIEVTGTVYEDRFNSGRKIASGLTRTALKEVTSVKVLESNKVNLLPTPTVIGHRGRKVPTDYISTYNANLNEKPALEMKDGIDFWESLESMMIQVNNPKVVGFSGGESKMDDRGARGYLNIFITPDSDIPDKSDTSAGGVIIRPEVNDYNPHIINLETHSHTKGINEQSVFNVGDRISGSLTGLMVYDRSFFNSGHYAMLLTEKQNDLDNFLATKLKEKKETPRDKNTPKTECELDLESRERRNPQIGLIVCMENRPSTKIATHEKKLRVVTYNIENLSIIDSKRLAAVARSFRTNFNCPDIINLVEIQDDNGISLKGGASAEKTLKAMIDNVKCPGFEYSSVNIDPFANGEGGQPGGNIRMSMLYNSNRVSFTPKFNNDPFAETFVYKNGELNNNPGRLYPNKRAFAGSRKGLIAEFKFRGQRVIVIGNHFNSKLGDASLWGANQPPKLTSEKRRTQMADRLNDFVENLLRHAPDVNIIVAGDFNAHLTEKAMIALEGEHLKNLVTYKDFIPLNDRYTTNYNGNSQGLDYILANENLLNKEPEVEILNINSDFMHKHSDHDPVLSGFMFP